MIKKNVAQRYRIPFLYTGMLLLLLLVGVGQGWSVALSILNLCLISAIMAIGVNIQWGYAGLFNVGVMGFAALGGLASVIISMPAVDEARVQQRQRAARGQFRVLPVGPRGLLAVFFAVGRRSCFSS